jgi:Fe-S-cluster containining protein
MTPEQLFIAQGGWSKPVEGRQQYDCGECGRCCGEIGGPLYLFPHDRECWREEGVTGLEEIFATTDADHPCPFVRTEKPFHCTIYAHRPTVCIKFINGGDECRAVRAKHGLPL